MTSSRMARGLEALGPRRRRGSRRENEDGRRRSLESLLLLSRRLGGWGKPSHLGSEVGPSTTRMKLLPQGARWIRAKRTKCAGQNPPQGRDIILGSSLLHRLASPPATLPSRPPPPSPSPPPPKRSSRPSPPLPQSLPLASAPTLPDRAAAALSREREASGHSSSTLVSGPSPTLGGGPRLRRPSYSKGRPRPFPQ